VVARADFVVDDLGGILAFYTEPQREWAAPKKCCKTWAGVGRGLRGKLRQIRIYCHRRVRPVSN
jgi:hypothetical protein